MMLYTALALVSFTVNVLAMGLVLGSNPRSPVNRLFALYALGCAMSVLLEYGYLSSGSLGEGRLWQGGEVVWPLCWLFGIHFMMHVTERTTSKWERIFIMVVSGGL